MGVRRRLVGVVAALLASFVVIPAASGAIVISRIYFDSPGADRQSNASLNAEWVELRNTGRAAVSLMGWTVRNLKRHVYRFKGLTLRPGATVKVHTGRGTDTGKNVYWGSRYYIWDNDGDKATLRDARGKTVDGCSYRGAGSSVRC